MIHRQWNITRSGGNLLYDTAMKYLYKILPDPQKRMCYFMVIITIRNKILGLYFPSDFSSGMIVES